MLRASIEYEGLDANLSGIADGAKAGDAGIPHGEQLAAFADAAVAGDEAELASARNALHEVAGPEVLVDAAAVVGNFERMVRIADGAGIALDPIMDGMSAEIRDELGLEDFRTRRLERAGPLLRVLGPALRGIALLGLRIAGRRARPGAGASPSD